MINSNGWLLTPKMIKALNTAGLYGIQLSCDALEDNTTTQKSMKRLKPKLELLKELANFNVRINAVLGSTPPEEVIEVAKIVSAYDFDFQCSLMRNEQGEAIKLEQHYQDAYHEIRSMKGRLPTILNDNFQLPLIKGEPINWKCRSGARYFHIDEHGLIHLCQPRTGIPAKKLEDYTHEDIHYHFNKVKTCSALCPHAYAHIGSRLDKFRPQSNN